MRTWRTNRVQQRCGGCDGVIEVGEKFLTDIGAGKARRCLECGERMFDEPAPEVITEDEEVPTSVPAGVTHQPSLGLR